MTNKTIAYIYLEPTSLCHNYSFLSGLLFIHPEAFIGIVEKKLLNFWSTYLLVFQKIVAMKISGNFPKNIHLGVHKSSTFASLLGLHKTTCLSRFMSVLDLQKKACLRKFRRVQWCACGITGCIWQSLKNLQSLFGSEIYVLLNEKWKIYKSTIRSTM